ncbi:unnamed protein product [Umbelopsis vinacea]
MAISPHHSSTPQIEKDPRVRAEQTANELEKLGHVRAAVEHRLRIVSDRDKAKGDAQIQPQAFEIGDHVFLRHEDKYGLEYNWKGQYVVISKKDEQNIYQLEHSLANHILLGYTRIDYNEYTRTPLTNLGTTPACRAAWR